MSIFISQILKFEDSEKAEASKYLKNETGFSSKVKIFIGQ